MKIEYYNDTVSVGAVPREKDIRIMSLQGFKTIVDFRIRGERSFGSLRLSSYLSNISYFKVITGNRNVDIDDVLFFYLLVYKHETGPKYAFSESSSFPLLLLLLFEFINLRYPLELVLEKMRVIDVNFDRDPIVRNVISWFCSDGVLRGAVHKINKLRTDEGTHWSMSPQGRLG